MALHVHVQLTCWCIRNKMCTSVTLFFKSQDETKNEEGCAHLGFVRWVKPFPHPTPFEGMADKIRFKLF